MRTPSAEGPGSRKLWARLVLVGLCGAAPLFAVSLMLGGRIYGTAIDAAARERRGIAVHRRLERVLDAVGDFSFTYGRQLSRRAPNTHTAEAAHAVDAAFGELVLDGAELGLRRASLERALTTLTDAPPSAPVLAERTENATTALLDLIQENADTSNLVLDDELDSYYLVRAVFVELPKAEQRILALAAALDTERADAPPARERQATIGAALLRSTDVDDIARDARAALVHDASFNGTSPSLQARLPPVLARYTEAGASLASSLERWGRGDASLSELDAGYDRVRHASLELSKAGTDELDVLLRTRIDVIQGRRARAYALVVATLAASIFLMGWVIRSLLRAREAEIAGNQAELAAKEAQLRALGDNLPGGMTYQLAREPDGSMRFLYVSAGVEALHGVTAHDVLANPKLLYDALLEEDRGPLLAAERESFENMAPFKAIARARRHGNGAVRWLEFASAPRALEHGRVVWDGIQMDITERQLAEMASRQLQQRFSLIFDRSPIPIALVHTDDFKFVAVNDAFVTFSGYSREQIIGRPSNELDLYARSEQRAEVLERLRTDGRVHRYAMTFRPLSGPLREILFWVEPIELDGDRYVLAMSLDVTEQQAALRQQRELEEQLREAQKLEALGTLAGGIAHDFNNILGGVMSLAELTKLEYPSDIALHENLDQILTASGRAAALVRQILSFSRRQKEAKKNLELAPIVTEALSLLRASLPATIAIEQALAAPVADVLANPTQVHQIVMNLCTNAAHAMKGKQGKLRVALEEIELRGAALPHVELRPGRYVRLTIGDTGHGMDGATVRRIFEPFFTTKGAGEGTGLGLSVVHGIVKEYGGAITVDSVVGQGTTFSIYLPAATRQVETAPGGEAEVARGHGERVLLVDDEDFLGIAVAKMMEHLGYVPVRFNSPKAALAEFTRDPPSFRALVTDYTMPELTGLELARALRAIRPDLPVIMTSGSSGAVLEGDLGGLHVSAKLDKPVSYATLASALAGAFARTGKAS
jgi:PAS domain S-box-containing protein